MINWTNLSVVQYPPSFPIQDINQITLNQQPLSLYYHIIIQFSMITQQVNPNCSLSICLLNLLMV